MHCDSSYAVLFAAEIEQRLVLAAHRLGIFRNQPSTARPPVFTNLCCKPVSDQCSICLGSTSRRQSTA